MRAVAVALAGLPLATQLHAQPLPVNALFCNIQCVSADAQASCRIALVDGLILEGRRVDIFALHTSDGVEVGGELSIPTGEGGGLVLAQAALELRFFRTRASRASTPCAARRCSRCPPPARSRAARASTPRPAQRGKADRSRLRTRGEQRAQARRAYGLA